MNARERTFEEKERSERKNVPRERTFQEKERSKRKNVPRERTFAVRSSVDRRHAQHLVRNKAQHLVRNKAQHLVRNKAQHLVRNKAVQKTAEDICGCAILDMPESRAMTEKTDCEATITNGLSVGRSEVLRSLMLYLQAQSQGHHTVDRLAERGAERRSAGRSSLKGRRGTSSVRRTLEPFQTKCSKNFHETGCSA